MTENDIIAHWRKGARDALEAARLLHDNGKYALALFDVHLAVEKALKAAFMEEHRKAAPPSHNLLLIAQQLSRTWTDEQKRRLDYLTQYAIAARYDDPPWAQREATEENSARLLGEGESFLSLLLP